MSKADFKHKPVSKWFLLDWQFILATGRFPVFKPAAAVVTALPFISDVARVVPITTTGFWLFWLASVLSLVTFAITHLFCPDFIRRYEDYSAFEKMGHAHRWIGWLFHLNQQNFSSIEYVVRETLEKGLTEPATKLVKAKSSISSAITFPKTASNPGVAVGNPTNVHRDLYIPLQIDGSKYLLALLEGDPKLEIKTKELFWIIYSDLTKNNGMARRAIWFLYAAILLLTVIGIGIHVSSPFWSPPPTARQPLFQFFDTVCRMLT